MNESVPSPLNPFQRDISELEARIDSLSDPKVKAIAKAQVEKMRAVSAGPEDRD